MTVKFSGTASAYGESHVQPFDPAAYRVKLWDWDGYEGDGADIAVDSDDWERLRDKSAAIWEQQGYTLSPDWEWGGGQNSGLIRLEIVDPDGDRFVSWYDADGRLLVLNHIPTLLNREKYAIARYEEADADTLARAEALVRAFAAEYNPEFAADFNIEFPEDYIAIEVEG